jgi:hypothetical protein
MTAVLHGGPQAPRPLITIPSQSAGPVIDGRLDDAQWTKAAKIPYLVLVDSGEAPSQPTEARLLYTAKALYIAFDCREAQMQKLFAKAKQHDGNVWADDCVEVFLKTQPEGKPYFHFGLNVIGTRFDAVDREVRNPDDTWNPEWRAAVSRGENGWQAEIEIPFAGLGSKGVKPGDVWSANLCREEKPVVENTSWSPCKTGFHEPDRFGDLVFGGETTPLVNVSRFSITLNGIIERAGEIQNPGNSPVEVRLETYIPLAKKRRSFARTIPVDAKGVQSFQLFDEITDEGKLIGVVEALIGGKAVYRILRPANVPPLRGRLAGLSARLAELENRSAKLPAQAASRFAETILSLKSRHDALGKAVVSIQESGPEQVEAITRELDGVERAVSITFLRVKALETPTVGELSDFYAWAASPWVQLEPKDLPAFDADLSVARAAVYRGEKAYAAANVTNLSDRALDLRVATGPLKAVDGAQIPPAQVKVHECAFVKKDAKSAEMTGDALPIMDQAHRLMVGPQTTGQVFLIVDTKGLAAGEYSGPVSLCRTEGGPPQAVTLRLTVYPIDLPDEPKPSLCTWGGILNISWATPDPAAYLKDAVEHGINVFLVGPHLVLPKLDTDGSIVKPIDYSRHDEMVNAYRPYGMVAGIYSIGIIYDELAKKAGMEYMNPAYKKGFITWMRDWIGHLKSLGLDYKDFAFELADEPTSKEKFKLHMDIGRLLREADPKARVILTANFNEVARLKEISEVTDIWVPHSRVLEDELARRAMKDSGKEMWVYVCSGNSKRLDPTGYYRILPWQAFRYDLTGWGFFAHMWWGELPWESSNTTHQALATYSTVYPSPGGPVTSRRWEAYWKGHEDFRALHLLKGLISEAAKAGVQGDALAGAKSVLEEARNGTVRLKELKEQDAPPSAGTEYLDSLRQKVAEASIKLTDALQRHAHDHAPAIL